MASIFDPIVQQFGALAQLGGAQQKAQNAAQTANTTYLAAQNRGANQGSQFPSVNAQQGALSGFSNTAGAPKAVSPIPTTGLNPAPMGAKAPSPQANITPKSNTAPSGSTVTPSSNPNMQNGQWINDSGSGTGAQPMSNGGASTGGSFFMNDGNGNFSIAPGARMPDGSIWGGTSSGTGGQNTSYPGLISTLANTAAQPTAAYTAAQQQYNQANQQLQALQAQEAQQNANIGGSRTNLAEAGGEQGLLQNLYAGQAQSLTNEMNAAQSAAQTATGQQGTQQSGLYNAAGLAAPQNANALGTYNPQTLQYSQYGGENGGGAATAGGVGTQIQQGAAVQQMVGQQSQAQSLAENLKSLIDTAGINPANASVFTGFLNGVNQWLNTQSGDPKYQNFANLINEISSRYAAILNQSGGTPTDQSTLSHQIINGLANGQDIKTVLQQLDTNATASINALKGASQTNAASGSGSAPSSGSTTFGSFFGG